MADGAKLLTYVMRRLGEEGLTVESGREAELFDYITEGRDNLVRLLAQVQPIAVQESVTLEKVGGTSRDYQLPAATKDPLACVRLVDEDDEELVPSTATKIGADGGDYRWLTLRKLRLSEDRSLTTLAGDFVLQRADIVAATAESAIGLPTPCHRAIGKWAALLALTADEETDATSAMGLLQKELDELDRLFGNYDRNDGASLRGAFLSTYAAIYGDMISG